MRDAVGDRIGGILPPGAAAHVQYVEALFAAIPQHRLTCGIGVRDVLPGVDFDLFAGGMFEESQTFGITTATVESYWIGTGITWRFGRGAVLRDVTDCLSLHRSRRRLPGGPHVLHVTDSRYYDSMG